MKILIGEDNIANQEVLREMLELRGYEVTIANNGVEVLQELESWTPDLLLLDIQMPMMDGLEVIRRLRRNEPHCALPVIAVTAYAMRQDSERTAAAGFDGYVSKPIVWRTLLGEIDRVLLSSRRAAPASNGAVSHPDEGRLPAGGQQLRLEKNP